MRRIISLAILFVAFSQVSFAGKIYVRKDNVVNPTPSNRTFQTIGEGLNNGVIQNGDTVIIYEGTYPERINFRQNNINRKFVIGSEYLLDGDKSHISKTIIDASDISQTNQWADAVIANYSNNTNPSNQNDIQVVGITLMNAKRFGVFMAGGIIRSCIFKDNGSSPNYTFMWINNAIVDSCTFENNKADILIFNQPFNGFNSHKKNIIRNTVFKNNTVGNSIDNSIIHLGYEQDVWVQNCLFYKNKNGSIFQGMGNGGNTGTNAYINDSAFISNNIIYNNTSTVANFRTWERTDGGTFYFINNIISKNSDYFLFSLNRHGNNDRVYTFGFYNNYSTVDLTKSKQTNLPSASKYFEKNNYYSGKIIFKDTANDDYHLADSSFGFNLGLDTLGVINLKDLEGNTRPSPAGSKIDLGPYESASSLSSPRITKATPGNGKVYLNWVLNQKTYDSVQIYRSTDSSSNNYVQVGSAPKKVNDNNQTTAGVINNNSNYFNVITYQGSNYYVSKTRKSWTGSREQAQADGGDLVTFETKEEFDYVFKEIREKITGESVWIGLYQKDKNSEPKGSFVWTNGLEMTQGYTKNFGSCCGEPNNSGGSEDYVEAWSDGMNDLGNGANKFFLVEISTSGENSSVDFTDTTVNNTIRYYYKLKTKLNEGSLLSSFSNIRGAKPGSGYPLPTNISLSNASRLVKITWKNPTTPLKGTGSYKIFGGTDSTTLSLVKTISDKDSSYVDSNKVSGKTYYYKLKSVDAEGAESDFTKAYAVKVTSHVYVSTTGKETAFGSQADPFATFNQAIGAASEGDTVIFNTGTHSLIETQRINKVISVASKYIISSDTNDINNTIITSANGIGVAFSGNSVTKTFIGLTFQNNPGGVFAFENVTVDNCRFKQNGSFNARTSRFIGVYNNSTIKKSRFLNNYGTIELSGSAINISANYFEGNIFGNQSNTQVSWFISGWAGRYKIENNLFVKNGEYVKQTWGSENETAVIGIEGWGDTAFVSNNTFIQNQAAAIIFNQQNRSAVIVNNLLYKNKTELVFLKYDPNNRNQFIYSNISNNIIDRPLNTYPNINNYAYSSHSEKNLVNPEFGFKDGVGYRLGNSSAAIGAGVKTIVRNTNTIFTGPETDYYGNARSNTKMDIGAEQTTQQFPAPGLKGEAGDAVATITWNKSHSTITGYNIFRSNTSIPDASTTIYKTIERADSLSLPESTLTNLAKYYYRIQAFDGSGNKSGLSNEILIRPNVVPAKLSGITASAGPRAATIEWTKKAAVYGYTIFRGTKQDSLVAITGSIDSAYFVDYDVKANTSYYYGIKVTDSIGVKSEISNVVMATPNNIHYVDTSSSVIQNGSKRYPFTTINDAVANTLNGDTVLIKKGRKIILESIRYTKNITIASEWVFSADRNDINSTILTSQSDIGSLFTKNNQNFNPTIKFIGLSFKNNPSRLFYADYVNVDQCVFEENGTTDRRGNYWIGFSSYDTIQNSIFRKNYGYIDINGFSALIRQNKFIDNYHGTSSSATPLIGGWVSKVKLENNYFIGNGTFFTQPWDNIKTSIITIDGYSDTTIVVNNTFINNNAVALQFIPRNKQAIVVNNLFYNNADDFNFLKFESGNNSNFSYSNISNNSLTKALDKYPNINSYNYKLYSQNNILNAYNAFADTVDYKLAATSGVIGLGGKIFRSNNMQIYTAQGIDYFGNAYTDKVDIGANQTTFAFPAPSLNEVEGGNAKIKVSWLKSSKLIKGYTLYRSESPIKENSTLDPLKTIDKPDSLYVIDAATNGKKYYYRVKAYDSSSTAKFSGFSDELSVTPNVPPAKAEVFAGEAGPRVNYLNWNKKDTTYKFNLYRGVSRDSLTVIARGLDSVYYVDKNLEVNKVYFYAIKVTDKGGAASEISDILSLKTNNIYYVDTVTRKSMTLGSLNRPFNSIQEAINASMDGDTILVKPGNYASFKISNKAVFVKSTDGASKTFVSATSQSDFYVVRVDGNNNDSRPYKSIEVDGFTINGLKNWRGGDWQGTISIRNNVSPVFKNNIIRDVENNHTLSIDQSAPAFINNLFINNKGHFLNLGYADSTTGNAQYKMPRFINCTFTKTQNWGNNGGSGSASLIPFVNCIFWGNDPSSQITSSYYSIRNSLVEYQDIAKKNRNIRVDPLFVNEDLSDYRLSNSSPALGKGVSSMVVAGQTLLADAKDLYGNSRPGPDSTKPDLGAHENPYSFSSPTLTRLQRTSNQIKLTFKYDKTLDISKLLLFKDSSAVKLDTLSLSLKDVSKDSVVVTDVLTDSKVYSYALRAVVNGVNSGISNVLSTIDTIYVPDALFEADTASIFYKTIDAGVTSFVNLNGSDYNYPSLLVYDNRWKSGDRSNKSPNDSLYFIKILKSDRANQSVKFAFDKRMHITLGSTGDQMQVLGPINLNFDDEFDFAAVIQKTGRGVTAGNLIHGPNEFTLKDSTELRFNSISTTLDTSIIPNFNFNAKEFGYNQWARNNSNNIMNALDMIDGNFDGKQEHIVSIQQLKWVPKFMLTNSNCRSCIESAIKIVKFIDINKDGIKDVVGITGDNWQVGYPNQDGQSIHLFVSNTTFGQYEMYRTGLFIDRNSSLFVQDYNNDGRPDLLTRSRNQINYSIYELNEKYSFKESSKALLVSSPDEKITSGDINNDGFEDVVTISTNGFLNVYLNDQKNSFKLKRYLIPFENNAQSSIWNATRPKLIDLNGDGFKDIFWYENVWTGSVNMQRFKTIIQTPGEVVLGKSALTSTSQIDASNDGYNVKIKWRGFSGVNSKNFKYNIKVDTTKTYSKTILHTGFNYKKSNPQIPIVVDQITASLYQDSVVFKDPNISKKFPYFIAIQAVTESGVASDYKEVSFIPKDPLAEQKSTLPGMTNARFAWGDYNNDGQLDLAVIGLGDENVGQVLKIYRNDKGNLVDLQLTNKQLKEGDVKWVDIDKDGWLDLIATGQSGSVPTTVLFKNNEGIFEISYPSSIPALKNSRMALGDYDNNGTIDMIIMGQDAVGVPKTYLLNNDGRGNFSIVSDFNTKNVMPNLYNGEMRLIDYDLDGDLDLIYTGTDQAGNPQGGIRLSSLLDDQNSRFSTYFRYGLDLKNARFDLGDVDSDGDLDIIVMGTQIVNTLEKPVTKLVKNFSAESKKTGNYNSQYIYGNNFSESIIDSLDNGDVRFADINNDGLLDISISGLDNKKSPTTRIYINQGGFGNYSLLKNLDLPQFQKSAISWGDYNNDGNMDMIITGTKAIGTETVIYVNDQGSNKNAAPSIPTGLTVSDLGQGKIVLKWKAPVDDHTPSKSLSYMIRLGTKSGSGDLSTLPIDSAGRLQSPTIPVIGTNEYYIELPPGQYFWSVLAIDGNFKNSKFSQEQSFVLKYPWKYINQGGLVDRRISPIDNSQFAWADFNNDGLTDFLYLGSSCVGGDCPAGIYKNNGGNFSKIQNTNTGGFSGLNGIDNIKNISLKCKDINNDGYVDIFVAAQYGDNRPFFKAYINKRGFAFQDVSNVFNITEAKLLRDAKLDFADLDNNGTPDMIYSGTDSRGVGQVLFYTSKLDSIINQGNVNQNGFTISVYETNIGTILNGAEAQNINLTFTDFNVDKRIDMVMLYDNASGQRKGEIYSGTLDEFGKGKFVLNTDISLPKVKNSTLDVVDFNKDGYPDLAISGYSSAEGQIFKIYQNAYNSQTGKYQFKATNSNLLLPVQDGKTTWGDFNMDGYPDVIFSGTRTGVGYVTKMGVSEISSNIVNYTELPSFPFGDYLQLSPTMGDIMGDGQLGVVLVGRETYNGSVINAFKILQNVRGLSAKVPGQNGIVQGSISIPFTPLESAANGMYGSKNLKSKLKSSFDIQSAAFKFAESIAQKAQENDNQKFVENLPPNAPTALNATILQKVGNLNLVKLGWKPGKDDLTPDAGLTFALRVGKKPGKSDVIDAEANLGGDRKTPTGGNTENNTQWDIQLPNGTYYWSVQAVDASFAGSNFAPEATLIIQNDSIVSGSAASDIFLNGLSKDTVYLAQNQQFSTVKYKLSAYSVDSLRAVRYNYSLYDDDDFTNPSIIGIDTSLNNLYFKSSYQKDAVYNTRIRATDVRGLAYDKRVTFIVVSAPTNLLLDGANTSFVNYNTAKEAEKLGIVLTGTDDRIAADKLTFSFIDGAGSENNSLFGIKNGNILYNKVDIKLADTLRVRVAVSNGFASLEKAIKIYAGCNFTSVKFTDSKSEAYRICEGDVVNLTLAKSAATINIFKDGALLSTASNTNKVSINAPGRYYAIYSSDVAGACGNKTDSVLVEYSVPVTNISYTGSLTICSNTEKQLTATAATGYKYEWFRNNQSISLTSSIINAKDAGKYKVKITNAQNCSATSNEVVLSVIQAADATLSQKVDTTICQGTVLQLKVADGTNSYQWFRNGSQVSGATTSTYNFSGTGSAYVRITASNGCISTSATRNITTVANPALPNISVNGTTDVCLGKEVLIQGQVLSGITYQWYKDNQPIANANSVNYTAKVKGSYYLQVTNLNKCVNRSAAVDITNNIIQKPTVALTGDAVVCQGSSPTLTSSASSGNQWYKDGVAIFGATSVTYMPTSTGVYNVAYVQNGCSSDTSASTSISVKPLPSVIMTASATSFCAGGNAVLLANTESSGVKYQWLRDATAISGATTNSYNATDSGNYAVKVILDGCEKTTNAVAIKVNATPERPSITWTQGSLTSSSATGNQWYNSQGDPISGATTQAYRPTTNGYYYVKTTINGCTSIGSANYYFVSTAVLNLDNGQFIKFFPNPVINSVRFDYLIQGQSEMTVTIFDMSGKLVMERKGLRSGSMINLTGLAKGSYMIKVLKKDGKVLYSGKIAKQ